MKPFEVTVTMPGSEPALQILLDAAHWMGAWKMAMAELGLDDVDEGDVTCKIRPNGAVEVIMSSHHGRRFLVTAASEEPALAPNRTPTEPSMPRHSHERITIEELKPVTPDQLQGRPNLIRRRNVSKRPGDKAHPRVSPLNGGQQTNLREAIAMLSNHVRAETTLLLLPCEDRTRWSVSMCRGQRSDALKDGLLDVASPVPGPVGTLAGRRAFVQPVSLTFERRDGDAITVQVSSALWSPVRVARHLKGVFLVLNAGASTGFGAGEFDAIQQLAALVSKRQALTT